MLLTWLVNKLKLLNIISNNFEGIVITRIDRKDSVPVKFGISTEQEL